MVGNGTVTAPRLVPIRTDTGASICYGHDRKLSQRQKKALRPRGSCRFKLWSVCIEGLVAPALDSYDRWTKALCPPIVHEVVRMSSPAVIRPWMDGITRQY